jgi:hypothetical protein
MLTATCDKWPDFLEVHQEVEDGPPSLVFVCLRKNSRSFQTDQLQTLRWLEKAGLKVVVRIGAIDVSIDEFERGGSFGARGMIKPLAQSTFYNKQAELKRNEEFLRTLPDDHPAREGIVLRISQLRTMLGLHEASTMLDPGGVDKALQESDKKLDRMKEILDQNQLLSQIKTNDELSAKMGVQRGTPEWEKLLSRWRLIRKPIEEAEANAKTT